MSDVDLSEFFRLAQPKRPPCRVGFALNQLKPKERAQLTAALAADAGIINAGAVEKWLKARDHTATAVSITNHRNGKCSCA